jgi:anti-sigma factor RsiW
MRCQTSENEIALYVEGDLEQDRARQIEFHLRTCVLCGTLAEELRDSQSVFKTLKQDTVSPAALASVRTGIFSRIDSVVKLGWGRRWIYAAAGFAMTMAMGVALAMHMRTTRPLAIDRPQEPPLLAASAPAPGSAEPAPSPKSDTPASKREPQQQRHKLATRATVTNDIRTEPEKQIVVKLLTDDPNVVIYWLVDEKNGDSL